MFGFEPLNPLPQSERKGRKDESITPTIHTIISSYLTQYPDRIILFVCDSKDGDHFARARLRLFQRWYTDYTKDENQKLPSLEMHTQTVASPSGPVYTGLLIL